MTTVNMKMRHLALSLHVTGLELGSGVGPVQSQGGSRMSVKRAVRVDDFGGGIGIAT